MSDRELIERLGRMREIQVQVRGETEVLLLGEIEAVTDSMGGIVGIVGDETASGLEAVVQWSEVVWVKGLLPPNP